LFYSGEALWKHVHDLALLGSVFVQCLCRYTQSSASLLPGILPLLLAV
jgi:hypothetical protein